MRLRSMRPQMDECGLYFQKSGKSDLSRYGHSKVQTSDFLKKAEPLRKGWFFLFFSARLMALKSPNPIDKNRQLAAVTTAVLQAFRQCKFNVCVTSWKSKMQAQKGQNSRWQRAGVFSKISKAPPEWMESDRVKISKAIHLMALKSPLAVKVQKLRLVHKRARILAARTANFAVKCF